MPLSLYIPSCIVISTTQIHTHILHTSMPDIYIRSAEPISTIHHPHWLLLLLLLAYLCFVCWEWILFFSSSLTGRNGNTLLNGWNVLLGWQLGSWDCVCVAAALLQEQLVLLLLFLLLLDSWHW